jgi:hypothetical protein
MRAHFERQLPHMSRARTRARNAPRGAFLVRWRALVLPSLSAPSCGRLLATGSRCERQAAERCPARMPAPPGLPRRSTAQRSSCAWCLITASVEATCLRELTRRGRMVVSRAALLCAFCAGGLAGASAFFTAPVGCVMLRGRRVGQGLSLAATRPRGSERLKMVAAAKRYATPPTLKKPTTLEGQAIPASMKVACPWRALCFT